VDPGPKDSISTGKFPKNFNFFQAILQKNIEFCRQISENFEFFRQLKKFDFPSEEFSIYSGGAQRPARGPHLARDGFSCGPRWPSRKWTI